MYMYVYIDFACRFPQMWHVYFDVSNKHVYYWHTCVYVHICLYVYMCIYMCMCIYVLYVLIT